MPPAQGGVAFAERNPPVRNPQRQTRRIPVYVGVDVGSITTKVVVIDEAGAVLATLSADAAVRWRLCAKPCSRWAPRLRSG